MFKEFRYGAMYAMAQAAESNKQIPLEQYFNYYIDHIKFERVQHIKDLGFTLDSQLKFKHHIQHSTILGFISRKTKNLISKLSKLYTALLSVPV